MSASTKTNWPLQGHGQDGRMVATVLAGLAFVIYLLGFRSASFPWVDAIGAAFAHVVPGAVAGITVWRLQPWLRQRKPVWLAHMLLAVATGLFWLVMMLIVTYLAKPNIFADVARKASVGTMLSGIVVYTAIAFVFALLQAQRRAVVSDAARARAELAAVRARVEPHFLYNTLETISGLVRQDPAMAEKAIGQLGRLLRRVLDTPLDENGDELIPLREELTFTHDYLAIERLRLGNRLKIVERVDEDTLELGIPAMSLQVLVENAVIHGISVKAGGGTISVSAARRGEKLLLIVADDGVGADESKFERGGLGIGLLRKRLESHFPDETSFDVAAAPRHGVSVRLSIPAIEFE